MADLRVIDGNFNLLASIDNCESITFTRKLHEIGTIEIHLGYQAQGADQIRKGRIVFTNPDHPFLITGVEVSETTQGAKMAAFGSQLKGITARRVTLPDAADDAGSYGYDRYPAADDPDAPAETVMKYYIDKHMASPPDSNRVISQLEIAADQGRGVAVRWSSRFETLAAVMKAIGEWSGIGHDIRLDLDSQKFIFDVVPGVYRGATSDAPVVFSLAFGNVDSTKYANDDKALVTVAYAGGAGDNEGRLIQAVFADDLVTTGLDRRESWLDCGNIEYVDALASEAQYRLKNSVATETLTADIAITGPFQYLIDWDIGDTVIVQSRTLGVELESQITEVTEIYENGKHDINVTFGKRQRNILDEIRKIEVNR